MQQAELSKLAPVPKGEIGRLIEFVNVIAAAIAGFVLGLAVHSAYIHSKKRGEFKRGK